MTLRLAVVSTAKNTNSILKNIQKLSDGEIEVVFHLGSKENQFKASSLSRMKATNGTEGHLFENQRWTGTSKALLESADFNEQLEEFIDQAHRTSENVALKSHGLRSMADYSDYYHILSDVISDELISRKVEKVLFFNVPHLTYDCVLYQCAKSMGIPTLIVTQSLFPNKFFSLTEIENFGIFSKSNDIETYTIGNKSKLNLFYMKGIKNERENNGRLNFRSFLYLILFLILKRPLRSLNLFYIISLVRHMNRIYGGLPKWRDPFARFFHEDSLVYFDHLTKFEDQDIDLNADFVYFPLQLQPELTTSALGGKFRDQAYAIERIASILPKGVKIYVKENPKQGAYMRGPLFFHRLKRIEAVKFLPSWANTHELTNASKFVATITGTVGWEAICQGKPVLVFGNAWYRNFEGVHEWSDELTYEKISCSPINHHTLEMNVGNLLSNCHTGVVERHYKILVNNFDEEKNNIEVAKTIIDLMKYNKKPTFGKLTTKV